MKISFAKNGNWREKMRRAFILRFDAKADFIQEEDAVADPLDDRFNGRYAYLTALTNETFQNGTEAALRCSFEGTGAPILMFVEDARTDADGDFRYAACVEVVIWQHGVNVWRYTRNEDDIHYYHAMADFSPLADKEIHDLRVKVDGNWLLIQVDGKGSSVCIPDMPEVFQVGAAVCEGESRLYDLEINESNSFENFMTWGASCVPIQK